MACPTMGSTKTLLFLSFEMYITLSLRLISCFLRLNRLLLLKQVYRAKATNGNRKAFLLFLHSSKSLCRSSSLKNLVRPGGSEGREMVDTTFWSIHPNSFTPKLRTPERSDKYLQTVAGALPSNSSRYWITSALVISARCLDPNLSLQ